MSKDKNPTKRMDKPDDTLVKRQSAYAGDVMHEYHNFPSIYLGPCGNEYPNMGGGVPRADDVSRVWYNGEECIFNREDESSRVDINTLKKSDRYRSNLEYIFKKPIISAITTIVPMNNCVKEYHKSPTLLFHPIIISYPEWNGGERLSTISYRIENEEILSNVEAMDLVMLPKMFTSNQDIVLEKVCGLLPKLKIEDEEFKLELVFEMQCVIHKYAKTIQDIDRLEEVIGLKGAITARQYQNQKLIEQGKKKGIEQGAFDMAVKFKKAIGIEQAIKISDFSREELENEKLNR